MTSDKLAAGKQQKQTHTRWASKENNTMKMGKKHNDDDDDDDKTYE